MRYHQEKYQHSNVNSKRTRIISISLLSFFYYASDSAPRDILVGGARRTLAVEARVHGIEAVRRIPVYCPRGCWRDIVQRGKWLARRHQLEEAIVVDPCVPPPLDQELYTFSERERKRKRKRREKEKEERGREGERGREEKIRDEDMTMIRVVAKAVCDI